MNAVVFYDAFEAALFYFDGDDIPSSVIKEILSMNEEQLLKYAEPYWYGKRPGVDNVEVDPS